MIEIALRRIAQQKGLTISQVQRQSGLTMLLVRRYWYNETTSVTLDAIEALCQLLQVQPGDLLVIKRDEMEEKITVNDGSLNEIVADGAKIAPKRIARFTTQAGDMRKLNPQEVAKIMTPQEALTDFHAKNASNKKDS